MTSPQGLFLRGKKERGGIYIGELIKYSSLGEKKISKERLELGAFTYSSGRKKNINAEPSRGKKVKTLSLNQEGKRDRNSQSATI